MEIWHSTALCILVFPPDYFSSLKFWHGHGLSLTSCHGFCCICHLSFSCAGQHKAGLLQNIIVDLLLVDCLFVLRPIYKNSPRQGILPAAQPLNNYRSFLRAVFSNLCNNSAANHSHCSEVYESSHFSVWHCFCWFWKNKNRVSKGIPVHAKKIQNLAYRYRCQFSKTRPSRRCRTQK